MDLLAHPVAERGETERIVGRWLQGRRDRVIIATKGGSPMGRLPWQGGTSRKHLLAAIDASLERLGTDHVDLYQLHRDDPDTPLDETLEALDTIVRSGRARYLGVSNWTAWRIARALGRSEFLRTSPLVTVQPRYNLLFRQFERDLLSTYGERRGPWIRLRVGASLDDTVEATSLLALLAAELGDRAERLARRGDAHDAEVGGNARALLARELALDDREILSSSPETFLKISGRGIETKPLKGTRPRFHDPDEDRRSAYELQTSAKEIAELVMITDLLRNDLGQVCEFGSVEVSEMLQLETLAQVHHLVSTVRGTLRADINVIEALAACFPGGSITGAPKKRAMEIIRELENSPRGIYCGAVGWLGFNGESSFNIAIRTLVRNKERLSYHVGAGIVADSDPEKEYEETLHKAAGIRAGLERCKL